MSDPKASPSPAAQGRILEEPTEATLPAAPKPVPTWAPLGTPAFRMLWCVTLASNICVWMNDVAAAWMMTSLTTSPVLVALVQTASTLPIFLFGLPSGALADILDRRKYFIFAQFWLALIAVLLCVTVAMDAITPGLLLALVFANGIGMAMRWPVFSALVPELVSKAHLSSAMALNAVSMNVSRIVGPLLAGALIASFGTLWVFVLNAALSILSGLVLLRWKREQKPVNPLGRERLPSALRVGLQFIKESPRMRAVIARTVVFFFMTTAIMALLPLTAKRFEVQWLSTAGVFTLLLASMGSGAVVGAMLLPRIRQTLSGEKLVTTGTCLQALAITGLALVPSSLPLAVACMLLAGLSLVSTANTMGVRAQMALPNWVRARGMAAYLMSIMGGTAVGAAVWGKVASLTNVPTSLLTAAITGVLAMLLVQRLSVEREVLENLSPSRAFTPPKHTTPEEGRVVVHIEFIINPDKARRFRTLMQESRRSRMRQGALSWRLLHSMERPERYVEEIVDESWTEHLRRFDRVTEADVALRELKLAFHVADTPPRVSRFFETE